MCPREWDAQSSPGFWDINRSPNLGQMTRPKTCQIVDLAVLTDQRVKLKESKKIDQYLDLATELKKIMEHEDDSATDYNWCTWNNPQRIGKRTGRLGNKRTNRDHPEYSIIKIGQNTEKSPGDLRKLAVIQTPEKNHQLTWVWKLSNSG